LAFPSTLPIQKKKKEEQMTEEEFLALVEELEEREEVSNPEVPVKKVEAKPPEKKVVTYF